ncbi:MAG: T9SS type A sorting domain-containing protein, partial [Desulfobacterales bacterium]|nr:T9SS type A sorting domain-containing protein [Desulfobacterales bacterium]
LDFYDLYNQYGVVLATFPLLQQSAPKSIDPSTLIWFINPIYGQKSLVNQPNGDYSINATSFYDYITIVNKGRIIKPVFYFPFEDDLKDASGNEFELKGSNAPIYTTGTIGKAVRLDGSSDYFDITQQGMINTGASPFTVCAWVYNTQTSAEREGDPDAEIIIHQLQGRVVLQHLVGTNQSTLGTWIGGASHQLTGIEFKPNQWQHVAMVCNPGTKTHTYYIDGKKTGQTTSANAFESVNYGFRIGAHKSGVQAFWHGLIDEVYMFRGELTGAQIKEVMDNKEITDLKENKLDVHELQVYPNPTRDYLTVSGIEAIKEIRLIGMDGRTVKRYDDSINIYMGNIFKGYYFIQVETIDGNRYLNKLIII